MNRTPQHLQRSGRSNMYSQSKCTNWSRFDPYQGERTAIPRDLTPTSTFRLNDSESCDIYERPLHEAFIRPFGVSEVEAVLASIPPDFLAGLRSIYLLGGTWKQDKIALGDLYHYGEYSWCNIYLFAFPRRRLQWRRKRLPKPDVHQEFQRAGADFRQDGDGWLCQFAESSLGRFYLYDVLIHEIGHHVDRHSWRPYGRGKSYAKAERFAEWFVREYGFRDNACLSPTPRAHS
jgi:hypothetical protein